MKKLFLLFLLCTACATTFTGSAHVEDGAEGCRRKCAAWGLNFGGMVAMGEYSSACICVVEGTSGKKASAAATSAAVGVVMRMRERQQNH